MWERSGHFEGDIILPNKTQSGNAADFYIWPRAEVPYTISHNFGRSHKRIIERAFREFTSKTCIRFRTRTTETDYIYIISGEGCSSVIGRQGGVQRITLGTGCVQRGIVIHELMHALGFWHEQSREDRDSYVSIITTNILPGEHYSFLKYTQQEVQHMGEPYDYHSIMHYDRYAFWNGQGPTIEPLQAGVTIGQRNVLSDTDVRKLKKLYKCSGESHKPGSQECENDNKYCDHWASIGECRQNPSYMLTYCKKSCGVCIPLGLQECADDSEHCDYWESVGECEDNPSYMHVNCKKTCKICGQGEVCEDGNKYCPYWAHNGECENSPEYMSQECKLSCQLCKTPGIIEP